MSFLVIDSGSTKSFGVLIDDASQRHEYRAPGVNPYVLSIDQMSEVFREMHDQVVQVSYPDQIFFYGAGCSTDEKCTMVRDAMINGGFHRSELEIQHDLLASARALFQHGEGIACILGTGSSSGYYNGQDIASEVMSLGYLFGDEGAGFHMGQALLNQLIKGHLPADLEESFRQEFKYSNIEIKDLSYASKRPNQFIASFTPFLKKHLEYEACREIVDRSFEAFIELNLLGYDGVKDLEIGFVGSIAEAFSDRLVNKLGEFQLQCTGILKEPMPGLLKYHGET